MSVSFLCCYGYDAKSASGIIRLASYRSSFVCLYLIISVIEVFARGSKLILFLNNELGYHAKIQHICLKCDNTGVYQFLIYHICLMFDRLRTVCDGVRLSNGRYSPCSPDDHSDRFVFPVVDFIIPRKRFINQRSCWRIRHVIVLAFVKMSLSNSFILILLETVHDGFHQPQPGKDC